MKLNINDKDFGIDALQLLKWINSHTFFDFPKNPISNNILTFNERWRCFNIVKNFYKNNILFNDFYIKKNKEYIDKKKNIHKELNKYIEIEYYRVYPKKYLKKLNNLIIHFSINADYFYYQLFGNNMEFENLPFEVKQNFDRYNLLYGLGYDIRTTVEYAYNIRKLRYYKEIKYYLVDLINSGHFQSVF